MLTLTWVKPAVGWLPFETFDLRACVTNPGAYVIWHSGRPPWTVRVGQGNVPVRLGEHRGDQQILAYRSYGLYVTWAVVPAQYLDGVERYLADQLRPLVGDRYPDVVPIPVNLPWAA